MRTLIDTKFVFTFRETYMVCYWNYKNTHGISKANKTPKFIYFFATLGALTGLEIVEGTEDEEEVFQEAYDKTELEGDRRDSTTLRLETQQNSLIKRMEVTTRAFDIDLLAIIGIVKGTFLGFNHLHRIV